LRDIFVVSGPSGCGKTTLVKRILETVDRLAFLISHTTRKRRETEVEGKDYFFVSKEAFKRKIAQDAFAEWAEVHGNFYGTSKEEIEKKGKKLSLVLDIDIQGAEQIKKKYKESVLIFIFPPRFDELKRRLSKRGDETEESIERRLTAAKKEILSYPNFDYIIINDQLDRAIRELEAVILSARCRVELQEGGIQPILASFIQKEQGSRR
jgi:guanylate kinase